MSFDLQPTLKGDLVTLRPMRPEDFAALFEAASDPLIWEQHPERDRYTELRFRAYFQGGLDSGGAFVVIDNATGRVIGSTRYCGQRGQHALAARGREDRRGAHAESNRHARTGVSCVSDQGGSFPRRVQEDNMNSNHRSLIATAVMLGLLGVLAAPGARTEEAKHADHSMNVRPEDLKWERIVPELKEKSSEIAFLRVDPVTKATHLMIRVPPDFHVPKHWHSANETHTIVKGSFIMECEGKRETLGQGSWNYIPAKMHHEAWTKPDEGALLFITVDSAWDINWVDGPPKPSDFLGGRKN